MICLSKREKPLKDALLMEVQVTMREHLHWTAVAGSGGVIRGASSERIIVQCVHEGRIRLAKWNYARCWNCGCAWSFR